MNYLITILIALLTTIGFNTVSPVDVWDEYVRFGAVSYPTSLDSLTNPSGTDSVATVSHSSQHSNANDAIEALEAKLGISASTAVSGSILAGNGTGSSIWTTFATTTNINATGQGIFGSFLSLASSTIIGGLDIAGNSTTTNATTTNFFSTNASSTNLFGADLTTCNSGQFLQWDSGRFGCNTPATAGTFSGGISTSTTNIVYKAFTVSMESGDQIWWWGTCSHNGGGSTITSAYKTSNDSSTTTIATGIQGSGNHASVFGYFMATTTYNVTVQTSAGSCDQGMNLMHQLIGS